jgi:hypothetical protein
MSASYQTPSHHSFPPSTMIHSLPSQRRNVSDSPTLPSCHARRQSNLPSARTLPRQTGFLFPSPARPNIRLAALCRARSPPEQQNQKQAPELLFSAASARRPCCARSPTRTARFDPPVLARFPHPGIAIVAQCVLREALKLVIPTTPRTRRIIRPCTIHHHHPAHSKIAPPPYFFLFSALTVPCC